jgi:hypothetical protein
VSQVDELQQKRVDPRVAQLALTYKLLREIRELKVILTSLMNLQSQQIGRLDYIADRLLSIEEGMQGSGEVVPYRVVVEGEKVEEIKPDNSRWRGVNVYNEGPDTCYVQINNPSFLGINPVEVEPGSARSWMYATPTIRALYAKCPPGKRATLKIEFLR